MRVTIGSLKGGVSKTTTSVHLAIGLAETGRTLLVDADPHQSSALRWSELAEDWPHETLSVVAWAEAKTLVRRVKAVAEQFDHIVIDTGPKNPALLRAAITATGTVVVPTSPGALDVAEVGPTWDVCIEADALTPVYSSVLLTSVRLGTKSATEVREVLTSPPLNYPVLTTVIPLREHYRQSFGSVPHLGAYADLLTELQNDEQAREG